MSACASEVNDDALFEILKECKTLPNFLDCVFGFLQRRTDFYHVTNSPSCPVGLPEGLAERLVRHTFLKWTPSSELQVSKEAVVSDRIQDSAETTSSKGTNDPNPSSNKELQENPKSSNSSNFSPSESYNGSTADTYCWSQSISDIDVTVKLPESICSKDVSVVILPSKITINAKNKILLEGDLCQKCKSKEAIWSIEDKKLQIHIDKLKEIWWDCLITTDNKIDLSKIDNSRPFEDLSDEARSKIEELGWNLHRKKLGLPTTEDLSKHELLKTAWNVEGSPFSGPFEPNSVNFV